MLSDLGRDSRYAIRTWSRNPGFAIVAILTLALGIGAATAVFSIVEAILLRPLPYAGPDRIVAIWDGHITDRNLAKIFTSYDDFENWRSRSGSFERIAAATWATGEQILTGYGGAKIVLAIPVSTDFFSMLGVAPAMGRAFEPADLRQGCTVVLAHRFWRSTLLSPADIVGRSLAVGDRACTVAGVMLERFAFYPTAADMWTLITPNREQLPKDRYQGVGVFGRLRPGVTRERAQAEIEALHRQQHAHDPHGAAFAPTVYPHPVGQRIRTPNTPWSTVVGVVGNQKTLSVYQEMNWIDAPFIYRPLTQSPPPEATVAIRTPVPEAIGATVQRLVAAIDPDVPLANLQTMRQRISRDLAYPQFRAAVLGAFSAFSLLLAFVGLYAVLCQLVAQRTHEFGVRLALGASSRHIARLVGVQGGVPTVIGLAAGMSSALAFERFMSSLLYGVKAVDPMTLGSIGALLLTLGSVAMFIPARRATSVDPMTALRSE